MNVPTISIIIPVKPGGEVRALERLRRVDYPVDAYEVLVAEGTCPSRQRNRAAGEAGGDILYFLDDDSVTEPGFLRLATGWYRESSVAAVGGPSLTPASDSRLQQSFGMAFASPFGGGSVRNRYRRHGMPRSTGDHELILCNLSISARAFREAGGFDERLYPNEENELLVRLQRQGFTLVHVPELAVNRSQRSGFCAFVRQLFGYGNGRARQILLGGGWTVSVFIPALFLLYLLSVPFINHAVYYLPLLCYLGLSLCSTLVAAFDSRKALPALFLPLLFPTLHLSYGAGLLFGMIAYGFGRRNHSCGEVVVKRIKGFDSGPDW